MEVFDAIKMFLKCSWDFFAAVEVPGLGVSFATLFVGLFLANLGLRFLFMILGVSAGSNDLDRAERHGIISRRKDA